MRLSGFMSAEPLFTNRLVREKSIYLLRHAHDPIDWFPWGDEPFLKAREEGKPIFLSIGYAGCQSCFLMQDEVFTDLDLADKINDGFICIKVDKEELPFVDSLYMELAQGMIHGALGWPLNLILTPDLYPIFVTTYLPKDSTSGLMGLSELIDHVAYLWRSDERFWLEEQAGKIVDLFKDLVFYERKDFPLRERIDETAHLLFKIADPLWGGFKGVPKFPLGYQLSFLVRYAFLRKDGRALFVVNKTLERMRRGAIYDQIGGGFFKYVLDEEWREPHFEKTLGDNAILIESYLDAYLAEGDLLFREVVIDAVNSLLREMKRDSGGFFQAEDGAFSGKQETIYKWSPEEFKNIFGSKDGEMFCLYFDIAPFGQSNRQEVLTCPDSVEEFSQKLGVDQESFEANLKKALPILRKERKKRESPRKDHRIFTVSNGMVIHSLARSGVCLRVPLFLEEAKKCAHFILENCWKEGMLMHRYLEGEAAVAASLEDYAYLIRGLITLFEVTQEVSYISWALDLTEEVEERFRVVEGGYYQADIREPHLIVRKAPFIDGSEPSGNGIHGENLLRLFQMTTDLKYKERVESLFGVFSRLFPSPSAASTFHAMNLARYYDRQATQFILVLDKEETLKEEVMDKFFTGFYPHRTLVTLEAEEGTKRKVFPRLKSYLSKGGETTLHVSSPNGFQKTLVGKETILSAFI